MCRSTSTSRPDEIRPPPYSKHALRRNENTNAAFFSLPARCFGDKGDVEDITEGTSFLLCSNVSSQSAVECRRKRFPNLCPSPPPLSPLSKTARAHRILCSRHHLYGRVRSYRQLSRDRRQRWSSGIVRTERDRQSSPMTRSPTGDELDTCVPGC